SRQAELCQTRLEVARKVRYDAQAVAPGQPLQHRTVALDGGQGVAVQASGDRRRIHALTVGKHLAEQAGLRFDRGPEAERGDTRQVCQGLVGDSEERLERREVEGPACGAI